MARWIRFVLALMAALTLSVLAKPVPKSILNLVDEGKLQQAEQQLRAEMKDLQGAERAPFSRLLADILYDQKRFEESLKLHRDVSLHHSDPEMVGFSLCQVGNISVILGRDQVAEGAFRRVLAEMPDSIAALRAAEGLADVSMRAGRLPEAVKLLDQVAELWKIRGDENALAAVLIQKAQVLLRQREYRSAQKVAAESVALARTVEGLTALAQAHHFQLDYDAAILHYKEALQLAEQSFGETSDWARIVRTSLGIALTGHHDYAEALEVYLAIPEELYPDRPFYLSYLYEALEQPADAVAQARLALDRLASLPPGSEGQTRAILVRGLLSLDRLDEADKELDLLEQIRQPEQAFEVALLRDKLLRQQGRHPEARRLLEGLEPPQQTHQQASLAEAWALLYIGEQNFEAAKPWLEKAVRLRGEDTVGPWVFLRLAEGEAFAGNLETTSGFLEKALTLAQSRFGGRHLLTASTLRESADVYAIIGEGEKVETVLRQSLDIYESKLGTNSFEALLVRTRLGIHEVALGRPSGQSNLEAVLRESESLPLEERGKIEVLACLGMFRTAKDAPSAIQWLDRGLKYAEGPYRVAYLIGLASKLVEQKKLEEARAYAQRVLEQSDIPSFQSSAHLLLAEIHREEPEQAKYHYEQAIALDPTSFFSLLARTSLATLYLNGQRPELALPILQTALEQEKRFSTTSGDVMYVGSLNVEALLSLNRPEEALTVADGSLARSLSKLIAKQTAGDLAGIPPEAMRRLDALGQRMLEIDSELRSSDPLQMGRRQKQAQLTAMLEQLSEEKDSLLGKLSQEYPRYSELLSPTPIDVAGVQSVLRDDEVALLYYLGPRSFVFIVTRDKMSFTEMRTSASDINALAESYSRSIGSGRFTRARLLSVIEEASPETTEDTQAALSDAVFRDVKNYLGLLEGRSFIIVPTQNLWMVPFESLAGLEGEEFLIQERSISYAPSLSLFVRFRQLRQKQSRSVSSPLVLGGANYSDRASPLPFAEKEANIVAERWADSSLYTGERATELAYLENAERGRAGLIHFATHGVLGESPALLLTAADGRDGRLEMSEILSQPIDADLVALSACSSGRGWVRPGEGVVGLSRAFLHAGASSVMVSLWNVNDRSTARLMELFYQGLEELGPSKALRQAQLKMIDEGSTLNQWAPFVIVGAP